jgi:hypothetical protein
LKELLEPQRVGHRDLLVTHKISRFSMNRDELVECITKPFGDIANPDSGPLDTRRRSGRLTVLNSIKRDIE